jgi:ribonuclease P protein subunit RPR2
MIQSSPAEAEKDQPLTIGSASESQPTLRAQTGKKKSRTPRLPPHFARDLGHIVFRGNERLPDAIP